MSLDIWNELPGEKKLVDFKVDYNNSSFLTLESDKKVPWGMKLNVAGQLWLRDENFPSCSGSGDFVGRKITFSGNGIDSVSTLTDAFSKFKSEIDVGKNVLSDCNIQAHYEGDPLFFGKCDSEIRTYEVVKHDSYLNLTVEVLVPKFGDLLENSGSSISLKTGRYYLLKGHLHDITCDSPISGSIIKFVTPKNFHLLANTYQ